MVNWTNVTDFGQIPAVANEASNNTFWVGMLYMMWVIMFLALIGYGWEVAIMVSAFASMIIGLLLVYAGLVGWTYMLTFVGIVLFMALYITWTSKHKK